MVLPKKAEERLRAAYTVVAAVSVCVLIGLGFTAMRGPGRGYVLVFAAAAVTAAALVTTLVRGHLRNRRRPTHRDLRRHDR